MRTSNPLYVLLRILSVVFLLVPFFPGAVRDSAALPNLQPELSSPWTCTPPVIDGVALFHEWGAAPSIATAHGRIHFMNDATHLYFLFDVVGDTVDDPPQPVDPWGDFFWLTFDVNLDAMITAGIDLNYTFPPSLPYQIGVQTYLGPETWSGLNPTSALLGVGMEPSFGSTAPHRIWEMAIPLLEIGAAPGSLVRTGFRLNSQNPSFQDDLPQDFPIDFSELVTIALSETGCQVGMEKYVNAAVANPGDVLNYRIDYFLPAGGVHKDVVIYDALPPGLTYLPGSAAPPATFTGGVLTWKLGDLPGGSSGSVYFQALVDHSVCREKEVVVDIANLSVAEPYILQVSNPAATQIICRPVEFPTDDPPYAESEITVTPYPLVAGQPTMLCTTIANTSLVTQTVEVEFAVANFGLGLSFAPIPVPNNPRVVAIPPGGAVTVCIQWVPEIPGHQCIQVTVNEIEGRFPALRSQRNLDVNEVLVPGEPSTFTVPVGNPFPDPVDVMMAVRNNCPGWIVSTDPVTFTLGANTEIPVDVEVTPPPGAVLGSGCTIDIEAWVIDQNGQLVQLIGGIRKIDEPLIPLGPPGERPFAEKEIRVTPYPLMSGEPAEVCVTLENNTDTDQEVTVEFMLSNFGIGLAFNRIHSVSGPNPRTVIIPAHSTVTVCIQFLPGTPGHHCLAVKLSMPNGYVTYSRRNLDVAELLEPQVPEVVPVAVGNPTAALADIDLVVDNTCLGWTAYVSPTLLLNVGPNSADVRTANLTVVPPPGLLGTNCHIDLLAYINGQLIGGARKIDRPPTAPPIDEPPWAEREISVKPDPPLAGQPAQVCVKLTNPTPVDQQVDITFAEADFGAGISFTGFGTASGVTIPAYGSVTVCVPWTPAATGTLHRCLQIRIHQDGYQDVFSQRNVDLIRLGPGGSQFPGGVYDLPPFMLGNPGTAAAPFFFNLIPVGLQGMKFTVMEAAPVRAMQAAEEFLLEPGETREFFVRVELQGEPDLTGDVHYLDVLPYGNGQAVLINGIQSGIRYYFGMPKVYLPVVTR